MLPLFTSDSSFDHLIYRSVCLTSVCCKTIKRVTVARLATYLKENCLISPDQYGFRAGRSRSVDFD